MIEEESDNFFGVYLLVSKSDNPKFRGRTYIGYTVNPNRRIMQHNKGHSQGGAKKTSNRGPWTMAMIIHGFPNNISALRFEWAWQQPKVSRRLKNIKSLARKKPNESFFDFNFRILTEMLSIGPWNRLPLCIRWITTEYKKDFPPDKIPPSHMQTCFGRVTIKKKTKHETLDSETEPRILSICVICLKTIFNAFDKITCINSKCKLVSHLYCLANKFIEYNSGQYLPIDGICPICDEYMLWANLIFKKKNKTFDLVTDEDESEEDFEDEVIVIDDNEEIDE